jgi:hypothetical protein
MHHKLLLGSTALVSAGILLANATPADAQGIEVVLSGYTEFGAKGATDDTLNANGDRGYTFYMDNEIHVEATGTTDRGLTYGSYAEFELASGDSNDANVFVDEVNLFFSGGFGRIELGRQDGAEDLMLVGGEDAQAGTGGIDGDGANLCSGGCIDLNVGDVTKASYYTPRIGGFQLGASYVPDTGDDGGVDNNGTPGSEDFANLVSGGVNWVGAFGGVDLTLSAVGVYASEDNNQSLPGSTDDDRKDYAVGGLIGAGGLSFGATWGQKTDFSETKWANLGLDYAFGNASASVGFSVGDVDGFDDVQHVFVVSGKIGLAPGLYLKGDVSYNTEDPGKQDSGGDDQGDTIAGVISVQLDY